MWSTVYSISTILIIYNLWSDAYAIAINDSHFVTLIYDLTASGEKKRSAHLLTIEPVIDLLSKILKT